MRVLVTGHDGYIGRILVRVFRHAGHEVVGLDSFLYAGCDFGVAPEEAGIPALRKDVRDVRPENLEGFDVVVHLAGISNDPLGDLDAKTTYDVNHRGTVVVAEAAKTAGVERFLFSSSCSLYGAHGEDYIDESARFLPVTPYGESKVMAEQSLTALADDDFSPTFLRNGTGFGASPRLRGDLVVNNLAGYAVATGKVFIKSDGTPWRPFVHIEDISRAFLAAAEAPREAVHLKAYNVGSTNENYQIRDVAAIVEEIIPGSAITFGEGAGPDKRNYRVSCDLISRELPAFQPTWTVRRGIEELYAAYVAAGLTEEELTGPRLQRIQHVLRLQEAGTLDASLRVLEAAD